MADFSVLEGMERDAVDKIRTAFDKGYIQGKDKIKDAFQRGMKEAWELARQISVMSHQELFDVFGELGFSNVLGVYTVEEAAEKITAWKQSKNEQIRVGDEVIYYGSENKGVVTKVSESDWSNRIYYRCVRCDGDLSTESSDRPPKKTGRHFSEIEEVLKALKEG